MLEVVADGQVVNKGRILLYLRGMGVKGRKAAINMVTGDVNDDDDD